MTQYTPGPWEAERDDLHFGSLSTVVGGGSREKWAIRRELLIEVGGYAGPKEQEANTRLVSAAPELLEALEGMLLSYEVLMTESPLGPTAKDCVKCTFLLDPAKARKAINKAKGIL